MISQKNVQMLAYLCGFARERQYVRVEDLAAKFHVSGRTVRYDLDKIDYYLKTSGYPKLSRVKGAGILLDVPEETIAQIRQTLCQMQVDTYVLSRVERALYLRLLLFEAEKPVKYEDLAEELYVSRKTVIDDVRAIKEEDAPSGVRILSTRNGISYEGEELQMRRLIMDRTLELFAPLELWKLISGSYLNRSVAIEKKWQDIMSLPNGMDVEEVLRQTERQQQYNLSDNQFYLAMLLTILAATRLERQKHVFATEPVEIPEILGAFFDRLETETEVRLPLAERQYVSSELGRILNASGQERAEKLADIVTERLLVQVSDTLERKYLLDNVLRTGLREHLAMVIRNGCGHRGEDLVTIQTMMQKHERLYTCIRSCISQIGSLQLGGQEEMESALLALHFCASEERQLMTGNTSFRALVVCANGVGTARIVSATVVKNFPQVEILATTSVHNVRTLVEQNRPDFILTTVPLTCESTPVIPVSTLLTGDDLDKIRTFIIANRKKGGNQKRQDLYEELWNTVADTCDIRDSAALERQLKQILGIERQRQTGVLGLVKESGIVLGLEADDWETAVRESARPLVEGGYLEPRYVQAMVDNIREMGPYIVVTPGIAMPHAMPKDGVLQSCMGIAVLEHPVEFGNQANDPVRIVLCLGAMDNQEHMKELSDLIDLFGNSEVAQMICEAQSRQEVLELLRKYART